MRWPRRPVLRSWKVRPDQAIGIVLAAFPLTVVAAALLVKALTWALGALGVIS